MSQIRFYLDEDAMDLRLVNSRTRLLRLIGNKSAEEMKDRVEFLSAWD